MILLCFVVGACAHLTLTKDMPEYLDGFLQLPWGLTPTAAQEQMLSRPGVVIDRTVTDTPSPVLFFRNATFLGIPVDRCSLVFFERNGLSDVQLRFSRPDTAVGLFDSLRTLVERAYGPGISRNRGIEWTVSSILGGYLRQRRLVLTTESEGTLLLHAHADYAEIPQR